MRPIAASGMETKLREIALDPRALPPLNKLDFKTRNEVMNTFTKALGVQCSFCHLKDVDKSRPKGGAAGSSGQPLDFKAPTPNKKITAHMWNDFTRSLAMADGSALYCDSCHNGTTRFLDRKDLAALSTWMTDNYVDKLKRVDPKHPKAEQEHGCETCHGDPIEGKIISKLWKITPSP